MVILVVSCPDLWKAQKIIGFDRRQDIDAGMHIAYTIELDNVMKEMSVDYE